MNQKDNWTLPMGDEKFYIMLKIESVNDKFEPLESDDVCPFGLVYTLTKKGTNETIKIFESVLSKRRVRIQ